MTTFVDDLSDLTIRSSLNDLLGNAVGIRALEVTPRVLALLHLLLPVLSPTVTVVRVPTHHVRWYLTLTRNRILQLLLEILNTICLLQSL